jgi:ubiquinol-cytochrome c reductase cytochrome c1 subunit
MTGGAATALAVASGAWYYHQFGRPAYAMTPAEEGYVKWPELDRTRSIELETDDLLVSTQHSTHGSISSGTRPMITKRMWNIPIATDNQYINNNSLRRGFQVYREVCASCHSLQRIPYRTLVGTILTADEAKAFAEENEYDTEPNDQGDIEQRPGKLSDYLPSPYKNDEAARAANNGALPPDLSLMVKARHGGVNYIFSLLTGYPEEPPAGAVVMEGLNFNPYFPGTGIAMARVLYDGLVEYEDDTPATTSQMAKDVTEFLNWAAEPEADQRKKMGWKVIFVTGVLFTLSVWVKRYVLACDMPFEKNTDISIQIQVVSYQDPKARLQPTSHLGTQAKRHPPIDQGPSQALLSEVFRSSSSRF